MNETQPKNNTKDLLIELVKTSFKMRYQNSLLGILWVLIKPYATFIVFYFVWTRVINNSVPNYALYLLLGIIVYTYINELLILGQLSLLDRANIILKVNFPRQIAILSSLISAIINLGINLIFFFIIAAFNHLEVTLIGLIYFVFIILTIFILGLGIAFFTSIITIRLRDLKNIIELFMFLVFYASPILYVINKNVQGGTITNIILANPLGILINQARSSLGVYGTNNLLLMLGYFTFSIILFILGWLYFNSKVKKIAEFF